MSKLSIPALNIRYFLSKREDVKREDWIDELDSLMGCGKERAKELILRGQFTPKELKKFAEVAGQNEDIVMHSPMFEENVNVLLENVQHLAKSYGQKKMADKIGVADITVSRWCNQKQKINPSNIEAIHHRLQLPSNIDIRTDPIFLFLTPFEDAERKKWLNERINELDAGTLRDLFPALEKLLKD